MIEEERGVGERSAAGSELPRALPSCFTHIAFGNFLATLPIHRGLYITVFHELHNSKFINYQLNMQFYPKISKIKKGALTTLRLMTDY